MLVKKLLILFAAAGLAVSISGCTVGSTSSTAKAVRQDGGFWKTADAGLTWIQLNDLSVAKGTGRQLDNLDINKIAIDPQDEQTIYLATALNGIYYTLDGGKAWLQFKSLNSGSITALAVDYKNKCVVYAISGSKLFKTENCGRDFSNIYYHQKPKVTLTTITLDPNNSNLVYLGTSDGEVLKSSDGGHAWVTSYRQANDKIMDIVIDPSASRVIYAGTAASGIAKTSDGGVTWDSLGSGLKSYSGSSQYRKLIADPATPGALILASKFGMLRSVDGGASWQVINLLPDNKNTNILALAVNSKNSKEIYYVTAQALVKTSDGGTTWSSLKLPSVRPTTDMKISSTDAKTVYLVNAAPKN